MTAKEIQRLDYVREGVRYTIHVEEANVGYLELPRLRCRGLKRQKICHDRRSR